MHGRSIQVVMIVILVVSAMAAGITTAQTAPPRDSVLALKPASFSPQAAQPYDGTVAKFVGIEVSTPYDSTKYGRDGAVWASIPGMGSFNEPFSCRCATKEQPTRIRLRFEGIGGVHVVVASEAGLRSINTQDIDIIAGGVLASWDIDGPVMFYFGPGTNLRGVFVDQVAVTDDILPPSQIRGVRIQK